MLKLGSADVANIMLGSGQVDKIMLGTEEVWSLAQPAEPIRFLNAISAPDGEIYPQPLLCDEQCTVLSLMAGKYPGYEGWTGSLAIPNVEVADCGYGGNTGDVFGFVDFSNSGAGEGNYGRSDNQDSAYALFAFEQCHLITESQMGQTTTIVENVAPDEVIIVIQSDSDKNLQQTPPVVTDGDIHWVAGENWTSGKGGGAMPWYFEINYVNNVTSGSTTITSNSMGNAVIRATRNKNLYAKYLAKRKIEERMKQTGTQEISSE